MKIAICDDEKKVCADLEKNIISINMENRVKDDIDVFFTAKKFIKHLNKGAKYEIVFLDIELGIESGIDVAKYIRDIMNNNDILIVFISHKKNYAMELFEVRPLDFLIKPFGKEKVLEVYLKAKKLMKNDTKYFSYKKENIKIRKKISDIIYFESSDHKIKIITSNSKDDFYGKIDDVNNQLKDMFFLQIHKSFLVNYKHIKLITYDKITVSNGKVLNISQRRRKLIREQYMKIEKMENMNGF